MPDINPAMTQNTPNFSGALYLKSNQETPLLSIIGGRARISPSHRFVTGQVYSLPEAKIPKISEFDSLNPRDFSPIQRAQDFNVTQIFQEDVYVSYARESHMGALSGVNIAGQTGNPASEFDFQIAGKMKIIGNDIENTFINGKYHEAASDSDANQTRGLVEAIQTNRYDVSGKELSIWDLTDMLASMAENGAPTDSLVLWCDPIAKMQLAKQARACDLTIRHAADEVSGIKLDVIETPFGFINTRLGKHLPAGTALILNLNVLAPVENAVPGKGNFFYEDKGSQGAGIHGQIFGQIGLDYGPEWYHGIITNINPDFDRPRDGVQVAVVNTVGTTDTLPEIKRVTLKSHAINSVTYDVEYTGVPTSDPTLKVEYLVGPTNLTATKVAAELTEDMIGMFVKVRVTASGTATGTVVSGGRKLTPATFAVSSIAIDSAPDHSNGDVKFTANLSGAAKSGELQVTVLKSGEALASETFPANGTSIITGTLHAELAASDEVTVEAIGSGAITGTATSSAQTVV